jgi:uncharacterized protein (TIGR03085 family)
MTRFARSERQALCDTFELVGPDAPTLCSPWMTRDLAAHLLIRERRPDVAAAIVLPAMKGRLQRVQNGYAAWNWSRLINEVRTGPPAWAPTSLAMVDEAVNTAEFFVHHEDVLRGGQDWSARELPCDLEAALWSLVTKVTRLQHVRSRVGVVLVAPGFGQCQVHGATELGTVVINGTPGELLLYSFGRKGVAQVDLSGSQEAVSAL